MQKTYDIVVFPGDYCGPEVIAEAVKVLKEIGKKRTDVQLNLNYQLIGGAAIDATGDNITDEALGAAVRADAVLLGAVGGPKWGIGKIRPEMGLWKLRRDLKAFGNLRPISLAAPSLVDLAPLKAHICAETNIMIVRELTGGIYYGDRIESDASYAFAQDIESYTRPEIERVAQLAGTLAMAHDPPLAVTSLDKANLLAACGRQWRGVVTEVMAKEFPRVRLNHILIDTGAMIMVREPTKLNGIVLTSNMFGDIISDVASVIPGSLGLLPSASLTAVPQGPLDRVKGLYEPVHGSAPDIANKGIVNPAGAILSVGMMLKYSLSMSEEADMVSLAVQRAIDAGMGTPDIGGSSSTKAFGDAVVDELRKLP